MSLTRSWDPRGPYALHHAFGVLGRGPHDPAFQVAGDEIWRATRTRHGPATLRLRQPGGGARVDAEAWGPGAEWLLDGLPRLLGADDDPSAFTAHHPLVRDAHRRHPGLRLARTGLVLESLIPAVLEQKVTADEAYRAWRRLLHRFGDAAPGPHERLRVMPAPQAWRMVPSWEWHRAGVDSKRSATILRAVQRARRMEEAAAMPLAEATARLRAIPGIGPWTAAETLQRSNGDPDALTVGDLHLPGVVGYALTGERDTDDAGMLELLAPYTGQRHRAARLILLAGRVPARRAPRMPRWDIARL